MLQGTLSLYDIRDVEALAAKVVQQSNLELGYHDKEDLIAYLVSTCWELSLEWEPDESRSWGFAAWATTTLRRRVVDWDRSRKGRTKWQFKDRIYERPRPSFISYEDEIRGNAGNRTGNNDDRLSSRLAAALERQHMDTTPDRSPDLMRVLREGSGTAARGDDKVGTDKDRWAA